MQQRGRKSAAALAIVPMAELAATRPAPPDYLPSMAQAIWREVTGSRPAAYFDRASLGLLEVYCRSLAEHRRLATRIEALDPEADDYAKLVRLADIQAARVAQMATRMRLSQQSRTDSRGAGRAAGDHGSPEARTLANYGVEA